MRTKYCKPERKFLRLLTKSGMVYGIALFLGGCVQGIDGSLFCDIYLPVFLDYNKDTQETINQVEVYNYIYEAGCGDRN